MINAKNFFDLAQLAEASYALFNISSPGDALNAIEFSQAQATELANHWLIVPNRHQPNTGSGFSSTLFQSKDAGGGYVLAFRGTEGDPIKNGLTAFSDDLLRADIGDIVVDGIAIDQTVDLYNEWQRIKTTGAYNAAKLVTLDTETNLLKAAYSLSIVAGLEKWLRKSAQRVKCELWALCWTLNVWRKGVFDG